jgi:hypothetical protein
VDADDDLGRFVSSAVPGHPRVNQCDTDPTRFTSASDAHETAGHWGLGDRQVLTGFTRSQLGIIGRLLAGLSH